MHTATTLEVARLRLNDERETRIRLTRTPLAQPEGEHDGFLWSLGATGTLVQPECCFVGPIGEDPRFHASHLTCANEERSNQSPRDAVALPLRRHPNLVDPELRLFIGMDVMQCARHPHHHAIDKRNGDVMARIGEKFGAPFTIDGVVEDPLRYTREDLAVRGPEKTNLIRLIGHDDLDGYCLCARSHTSYGMSETPTSPRGHSPPSDLHPSLRVLLEAELAAGNVIREIGRNFPDEGSILVQLREPFKTNPPVIPEDVTHEKVLEPYWWSDEFRAGTPPHMLVG